MNTKTIVAAIAAAMGLAASAEIGNITFPASLGTVANDLNGQTLGTVTVQGGTMTITGATPASMASLTLTGDATVVTVPDAIKPSSVTAVAGVDNNTTTTYYNTWAAAVAAYTDRSATETLEMRSSPDSTAITLAQINDKIKVDASNGTFKDADIVTSPTDSKYIEFAKDGNVTTYIAKYDLSKATVADIASHMYDGTDYTPALTVTHNGGGTLALTDDYTVAWDANRHFGQGTVTLTGVSGSDYDGTTSVNFDITKRDVVMTSGSGEKVYDGTALVNNTVAVTGSGFVSGEGATYSYTGTQTHFGSSLNAFTYTLNDGTSADDYAITTANGTLNVTSLALTYTADNKSMKFGDTVPALTVSLTSGVKPEDGQTIAFTPSTTATSSSAKGTYPIALAGDTKQFGGDYTLTFNNGELTVGARTLEASMIAAIAEQVYTGHDIEPTPEVTDGSNTIRATADYTVSWANNKRVSVAEPAEGEEAYLASVTITATADGNYEGSATKTFVIDGTVAGEKTIALADDNALVYVPAGATVEVAHDQTAAVTGTGVIAKAAGVRAEVTGTLASDATVSKGAATYLYGNQGDVDAIAALENLVLDEGTLNIRAQEDNAALWTVTE